MISQRVICALEPLGDIVHVSVRRGFSRFAVVFASVKVKD
jgi:hypothetical protein